MLYYIPLLFVPMYVLFVGKYFKYSRKKKILLLLPFLYLLLLAAFRHKSMGTDYEEYIYWFKTYLETKEMRYNVGWKAVTILATFISNNYYALGLVTSLLILSIVFYVISTQKGSRYWYLSFIVYIFNPYLYIQSNFNIMRQGASMVIVLLAFYLLSKNKTWRSILLIVFAATFHTSAVFMLILPIIKKIKFTKRILLFLGTCSLILSLILKDSSLIMSLGSILGYDKYAFYEDTMFNFAVYKFFIYAVIFLLCYYYDRVFDSGKKKFYGNVFILSLCFLELVLVNDIAYRVYLYFATLHVILVPSIVRYAAVKFSRSIAILIKTVVVAYYVVFFSAFWVTTILNNDTSYFPYLHYWKMLR